MEPTDDGHRRHASFPTRVESAARRAESLQGPLWMMNDCKKLETLTQQKVIIFSSRTQKPIKVHSSHPSSPRANHMSTVAHIHT